MTFANIDEALNWLHNRPAGHKVRPNTLERVNQLLAKLDYPEKKMPPIIHVTGTNGKSSTATFIQRILTDSGYKTGLYISPFVETFNERIQVDGKNISNQQIIQIFNQLSSLVDDQTEFEVLTVAMIIFFVSQPLDVAVVEVGIGGTWDSTNVLQNDIAVITSVGLDHRQLLGNTIEEIAEQKAGIIKSATKKVVAGQIPASAKEILKKRAELFHINFDEYTQSLQGVRGKFEALNAGLAWAVTRTFIHSNFPNKFISLIDMQSTPHLVHLLNSKTIPGRIEVISKEPLIILDGAHNNQALSALSNDLIKDYGEYTFDVLFANLTDKQADEHLLDQINVNSFLHVAFIGPNGREAVGEIANWQYELENMIVRAQVDESNKKAILVTGSLYFVSDVRKYLKEKVFK